MNSTPGVTSSANYFQNDARREFKWREFINSILDTPIGQSQTIEFISEREARTAQDTIRDDINIHLDKVCIRTRCKQNPETGKWEVRFTRLQDRYLQISTNR
jgi:hypothetical protein